MIHDLCIALCVHHTKSNRLFLIDTATEDQNNIIVGFFCHSFHLHHALCIFGVSKKEVMIYREYFKLILTQAILS